MDNTTEEKIEVEERKGISGAVLKWTAMITMLIDHCAYVLYVFGRRAGAAPFSYDVYLLLRGIGRLAFPTYCFLIVEGFTHTRNVHKYALRLLCFGIISEVPFDMAFQGKCVYWGYQNVFFTLLLGLLAIYLWKMVCEPEGEKLDVFRYIVGIICVSCLAYCAYAFELDYGAWGVATILLLYVFRNNPAAKYIGTTGALTIHSSLEIYTIFDIPLFLLYNGKRGKQPKYLFYVFYPLHLTILGLVSMFVFRS